MINENNAHQAAMTIYEALGSYLRYREENDERFSRLEKTPDDLSYMFTLQGEDIPMIFRMIVNEAANTVVLHSHIPFEWNQDKLAIAAVAVCYASNALLDGCFDLDIEEKRIYYKMITSYDNDKIDNGIFSYMIALSAKIVDQYNDIFYLLNEGKLNITDLLSSKD